MMTSMMIAEPLRLASEDDLASTALIERDARADGRVFTLLRRPAFIAVRFARLASRYARTCASF